MVVVMSLVNYDHATKNIRRKLIRQEAKGSLPPPRTLKNNEWPPNYEAVKEWREEQLAKFEEKPWLIDHARDWYAKNPIDFINHWCDTHDPRNSNQIDPATGKPKPVWFPLIMFEKQEELVHFVLACLKDEQPGLIEKCRTMGATWVCCALSVWMWLFHPSVAVGWGSQDAVSVDRLGDPKSIFYKIRGLIQRLPDVFKPKGLLPEHLKQFVCRNPETGAAIVGEVGDNIGRGGRTRIYFKDESAHYEHPDVIEASLSENTRVPIDISSVHGVGNLFHRKRESGIDWHPGVAIEPGHIRVFIMDWRDHPEYDEEWYNAKRALHERQGTSHVFQQEIERNYASSVQGVIINPDWVRAAIDAHLVLGLPEDGGWCAGLDVGDAEDGDRNALVKRQGVILRYAEEWTARDPGVTARKAVGECAQHAKGHIELQYDCIGVGVTVKAEANRLKDEGLWPKGLELVPWNAGDSTVHPARRTVEGDEQSPRNKDFYQNLKAQAWWELRGRFYRTFMAVQAAKEGRKESYDPGSLISLDSRLQLLRKIEKELCQATASKSTRLKLVVDKTPEGTRSPNIADAIVMCYHPIPQPFMPVGGGPKVFNIDGVRIR